MPQNPATKRNKRLFWRYTMAVKTGLDILVKKHFQPFKGQKVGIVCNQASVDNQLQHIVDLFLPLHQQNFLQIKALFGPQHGLWGHTQDNMIEWQSYRDEKTGLPIFSLYGQHRKPIPEMLEDIEVLIIDLQDVGARYYTFIWTMALCMEAALESDISVVVLDRPNPIGGETVEGTFLNMEYRSFVGLYPLPQRHGMTIAEIARYLKTQFFPALDLTVIPMEGWERGMFFPETALPWVLPSPNIPTWETTLVYPGMCWLEATNLSEGRGTTRPFEIFGAPWIDGRDLCTRLNNQNLPGVYFRPLQFEPTFHKFRGETCQGAFIHVLDPQKFSPIRTTLTILQDVIHHYSRDFKWKEPPYEYEYHKLPFDILAGNRWLREMIENLQPVEEIWEKMEAEIAPFKKERPQYLIY